MERGLTPEFRVATSPVSVAIFGAGPKPFTIFYPSLVPTLRFRSLAMCCDSRDAALLRIEKLHARVDLVPISAFRRRRQN